MIKHTPGPWNSNRRSAADRAIVCAENVALDICVLSNRDKTLSEIDANARLIAAAPEMYSLIEQLSKQNSELGEQALLIMAKVQS